jgi:hypothetical protein
VNKIVEALTPEKMEYSGTLKPKTSRGIGAFARIGERKAHGLSRSRAGSNTPQLQGLLGVGRRHGKRSAPGVMDTMDDIKGLTPHASRVNGTFYVPLLEYLRVHA